MRTSNCSKTRLFTCVVLSQHRPRDVLQKCFTCAHPKIYGALHYFLLNVYVRYGSMETAAILNEGASQIHLQGQVPLPRASFQNKKWLTQLSLLTVKEACLAIFWGHSLICRSAGHVDLHCQIKGLIYRFAVSVDHANPAYLRLSALFKIKRLCRIVPLNNSYVCPKVQKYVPLSQVRLGQVGINGFDSTPTIMAPSIHSLTVPFTWVHNVMQVIMLLGLI